LFVLPPMNGRAATGMSSTARTHQPLLIRRVTAATSSPSSRRRRLTGAAISQVIAKAGTTRKPCRYFVLKAKPTSTAVTTIQRSRPASIARNAAQAAPTRSRVRSASGLL